MYILFWYKMIYTCTQRHGGCLVITESGCSTTFQATVLNDTGHTSFFTCLVSQLFQA